jgi:WD40 repeat protein
MDGHYGGVLAVALTTIDGRPVVISSGWDQTIRIRDLASGDAAGRGLIRFTEYAFALATTQVPLHPDRAGAVSGDGRGRVRVWDLTTRFSVCANLAGHTADVKGVALARVDGRQVAVTVGDDATVRLWDLTVGSLATRSSGTTATCSPWPPASSTAARWP